MADLQEVTRQLFNKAKKLANSSGWSVFVKVVSPSHPGEYFGTFDLTEKYRKNGLQLEQGECEVNMDGDRVAVLLSEQEAIVQEFEELKKSQENQIETECLEESSLVAKVKSEEGVQQMTGEAKQGCQSAAEATAGTDLVSEMDLSTVLTTLRDKLQGLSEQPQEIMPTIMEIMKYMSPDVGGEGRPQQEKMAKKSAEEDDGNVGSAIIDKEWLPRQLMSRNSKGRRKARKPRRYAVESDGETVVEPRKKCATRGRPQKYPDCVVAVNMERDTLVDSQSESQGQQSEVKPRKRGRPRKHVLSTQDEIDDEKTVRSDNTIIRNLYVCKDCNLSFSSVANLQTHFNKHSGVKPHSCDVCDKKFLHYNSLRVHRLTHTGEKAFACDICDKTFALANTLRDHMKTHTKERPHKCKICLKGFTQRGSLHAHMRLHTGEKPFECNECGKKFAQANGLRTHVMSHTGAKPYKCTVCDKAFNSAFRLKCHKAVHEDKLPYPCELCDKAFTMQCHLNQHHRKCHLKLRPYLCDTCGKDFADSKTLYYHKKIHSDDPKQFACKHCPRGFHSKSLLRKHERIHTGEKPFSCPKCGKKFGRSDNLRCHMKIHNRGDEDFTCDQCARTFKSETNLRKHQNDFHSVVAVLAAEKPEEVINPETAAADTTTTTYVLQMDPSVALSTWPPQVQVQDSTDASQTDPSGGLPVVASVTLQNATDEELRSATALLLSATQESFPKLQ